MYAKNEQNILQEIVHYVTNFNQKDNKNFIVTEIDQVIVIKLIEGRNMLINFLRDNEVLHLIEDNEVIQHEDQEKKIIRDKEEGHILDRGVIPTDKEEAFLQEKEVILIK